MNTNINNLLINLFSSPLPRSGAAFRGARGEVRKMLCFVQTFIFIISIFIAFSCQKQPNLKDRLDLVLKDKKQKVGIAIIDMQNGEVTEINGNEDFPLQSVFKFHIAAKVLDEVDKGNMSLNQPVAIKAEEIKENMYSPLRDEHGIKDMSMRLDSLIFYMVSHSDNVACDVLLSRIGIPEVVNTYFKNLGINGTTIAVSEEQMHQDWETQFKNTATPLSVAEALKKFYLREYLSGDSHNFLWAMMSNTSTGKNRLKAGVPTGSTVTHKTGTSGRNNAGLSSATNDAGIITTPDGRTYIIVVFVGDSYETDEANEMIIADVARVVAVSK